MKKILAVISGLLRDCAANTAVEYAVCLGLIIGAVLVAGLLIEVPLRNAFSASAAGFQAQHDSRTDVGQAAAKTAAASQSAEVIPSSAPGLRIWLPIISVGAVSFLASWWLIRSSAARRAPHVEPDPLPIPKTLQAKFVEKRQTILKFLSADKQQIINGQMAARNIMSKSPMVRGLHDDVSELRDMMTEKDLRHLIVCAPDGAIAGIISDRDVLKRSGSRASDIMTANPVTVAPDTPVNTVITMFLTRRINCVPVVHNGRVCGIITTSDLLMSLQCVLRLIEQMWTPDDLHGLDSPEPDDDELVACPAGSP